MKKSKILCILLSLILVLSLVPTVAFAADTHTVTFNANGRSGYENDTMLVMTVEDGNTINSAYLPGYENILSPASPIKDGDSYYKVVGYYYDTAGTRVADFNTPVTENIILYAMREEVPAPVEAVDISLNVPEVSGNISVQEFLDNVTLNDNLDSSQFNRAIAVIDLETGNIYTPLPPNATITANGSYCLRIIYYTKNDSSFSDTVSASVNNEALEEEILGNLPTTNGYAHILNSMEIYYLFGQEPPARINSVNMTVEIPNYDGMTAEEFLKAAKISYDPSEGVSILEIAVLDDGNALEPYEELSEGDVYTLGIALKSSTTPFNYNPRLVLNGKAASNYPAGAIKTMVADDNDVFVVMMAFSELPIAYSITAGADQEWTKGTDTGLEVTSDADFANFSEVKVDGTRLDTANYTAVSGSTKVTLKPAYLETLSEGTHTLDIVSTNGKASTSFIIKAAGNTGGNGGGTTPGGSTHTHSGGNWKSDGIKHWKECSCGAILDEAAHVDKNNDHKCDACGHNMLPVEVPKTGDDSNPLLYGVLMLLALAGIVGTTVISKRKKA